jgi:hypothetical protein
VPQANGLNRVRAAKLPVKVRDILYFDNDDQGEVWAVMLDFADGSHAAYLIPADMATDDNVRVSALAMAVVNFKLGPGPHQELSSRKAGTRP